MCNMLDKRAFHVASLDDCLICRIQFPVQRQRTHIVKRDNNQQYQHQASDNHGSYKEIAVDLRPQFSKWISWSTISWNCGRRSTAISLHGIFA